MIQRSGKESERIGVRPYFYLKYVASGLPFNFDNPSIIDNTILSSLDLSDETLISSCQEIQKRVIYARKNYNQTKSHLATALKIRTALLNAFLFTNEDFQAFNLSVLTHKNYPSDFCSSENLVLNSELIHSIV